MGKLDTRFCLLVEGKDDSAAIRHLLMRHDYDWANGKWVRDQAGFEQVVDNIGISAKTYDRLGVVVDADTDMRSRWTSVRDHLSRVGVEVPEMPDANGTIVQGCRGNNSKVGIWLMPNNALNGALEDFLSTLVPAGDVFWPFAKECCQGALQKGAPISGSNYPKARLHTWLAWKEEPGRPYGTAITAAYLGADSPEALAFVRWFKKLFSERG